MAKAIIQTSSPTEANPLRRQKIRWGEGLIETAIKSSALVVIIALVLIFIFIGKEALPIFYSAEVHQEVDMQRMFLPQAAEGQASATVWQPVSTVPKYSIWPLLLGTLKVTIVALLIAIPIALGAALFTSEFAPNLVRELIKPVIEILAGIPSVVLGFFGLMVLATFFQEVLGLTFRLNAITAGTGLALAVVPIIYTVAEDAFSAVPETFRAGSIALGANVWQTAWKVVMPAALPGVFAACVLGFGRAIGETMIVLMSSGNAATMSFDPSQSFRSFSATIAAELGEVTRGSAHYHVLFFLGVMLFIITFLTNFAGHWYVIRVRDRLQGKIR